MRMHSGVAIELHMLDNNGMKCNPQREMPKLYRIFE